MLQIEIAKKQEFEKFFSYKNELSKFLGDIMHFTRP